MSVVELPKLYTDAEAAVSLRCAKETVARLRRGNKLGYTRVGKKVYVTDAHLAAYLRSQECAATLSKEKTASGTSGDTMPLLDNAASIALIRQITAKLKKPSRSTS